MFGLDTEDKVKRAIDEIDGPLSVTTRQNSGSTIRDRVVFKHDL
jgi:hypothetical protein